MERLPYRFPEFFTGDWNLFKNVLQNRQTVFVYDIDGILANTPKVVLNRFTEKTGIKTDPVEIDRFFYLTYLAEKSGLKQDYIEDVENDWYKPEILASAQKYLYITPVIEKTLKYYGPDRNFALTSRDPDLERTTREWFLRRIPNFKSENILIRSDSETDSATFKVENLVRLAQCAPWVVFLDDQIGFVKAAIDADIPNCLVVNIPIGKFMPDFRHERLILIKRFPEEIQAMYPLLDAVNRAIDGRG